MNKTSNKNILPYFVSMNDFYVDEDGNPQCEEIDTLELSSRITHDLSQLPEFLPPHTSLEKPARILSYNVDSEPTKDGTFVAFLEFLPGDRVEEYYKNITNKAVTLESKNFKISKEKDICNLEDWLRDFIHRYQQMPRLPLYTNGVEKLSPATFNVEVTITR